MPKYKWQGDDEVDVNEAVEQRKADRYRFQGADDAQADDQPSPQQALDEAEKRGRTREGVPCGRSRERSW